ncbi:hypothetical protein [Hyphobacterium sp.]|uniref:hypothetical protein n=1 Tax=Hyphobacterium sp. TaxID=2004662 RepID=UPI003BA9B260
MAANGLEETATRQFYKPENERDHGARSLASDHFANGTHIQDFDLQFALSRARRDFENLRAFRRTSGWAFDDPIGKETKGSAGKPIERSAIYPDSHILTFSVLAVLILFEGLANAYFFSSSSDLGLLGGWLQAITISFVNVISAFFVIGYLCLRHLTNPQKRWSFIAAAVGLPIAVTFIVILNLAAAHYRDLLEIHAASLALGGTEITGELIAPIQSVFANPFSFQTLDAYLLLTLGLTFAIIAAYKGRTFDDAIPGFGVVQRRAERSARELNRVVKKAAGGRNAPEEQIAEAQLLLMDMAEDFGSARPR